MVFQRFSVSSGTYYARDNRLFPLVTQRVSSIADIHSPRTSGIGIKPKDMPEDAQILFLILALCHTVRVEREIEQVGRGAGDVPKPRSGLGAKKKMLKKPLKLITDIKTRKVPPRRQASIMRRASAMQSAEEAISSLRRGRGVMKTNYDYQVSKFTIPIHLPLRMRNEMFATKNWSDFNIVFILEQRIHHSNL